GLAVEPKLVSEFSAIAARIRQHRNDIERSIPGVVALRPGYKFDDASSKTSRGMVALVQPDQYAAALRAAAELARRIQLDIEVPPATPEDVLESRRTRGDLSEGAGEPPSEFERFLFRVQPTGIEEGVAPRRGDYQKPNGLSLREIVAPVK